MKNSVNSKWSYLLMLVFVLSACNVETPEVTIIPCPQGIELQKNVFRLSEKSTIYFDPACENEAHILQQILAVEFGLNTQTAAAGSSTVPSGHIYLSAGIRGTENMSVEEYSLMVNRKGVSIRGSSTSGVFYGVQSLRQMISKQSDGLIVPCATIDDKPRFGWRAFLLDEGRYFKGMDVVKNLLDEMALLKMNTFHWHLTDDQGWRIEIKKYPLLTETGSTRRMSETGTWLSNVFDSTVHSGFYTQDQIKEIIQYASDRHITIIPEIEMPGHASAAIASYPWLSAVKKPLEVPIRFGVQDHVYNVTDTRVIGFIHDVLKEVMELFPSQIIHIGGDEVRYDQWKSSAEVSKYMKINDIQTYAELQISFTNSISNYLQQNGHRMMGWNDILGGLHEDYNTAEKEPKQKLSPDVIIHFWTGDPKIVNQAVEKGFDVVNSYYEFTYIDYDYKTTSLQKAYSFDPVPESLPDSLQSKILGLGCQMWGEWIPTVEKMNYQIYPRIAAYAETGWSAKSDKNYEKFLDAVKNSYLMKHWEKKGITFMSEQFE